MRLDDESLAEGRLPDRHLLDRAVPDRPVFVVRYCGHVAVANTMALELAGIGPATPDPPGGIIDRDDRGIPTGILRETATEIVSSALRDLAPPVGTGDLIEAAGALASLGLASVGGIVDVREGCWSGAGSELDALVAAAPGLPIRIGALVIAQTPGELEDGSRPSRRCRADGPVPGAEGLRRREFRRAHRSHARTVQRPPRPDRHPSPRPGVGAPRWRRPLSDWGAGSPSMPSATPPTGGSSTSWSASSTRGPIRRCSGSSTPRCSPPPTWPASGASG